MNKYSYLYVIYWNNIYHGVCKTKLSFIGALLCFKTCLLFKVWHVKFQTKQNYTQTVLWMVLDFSKFHPGIEYEMFIIAQYLCFYLKKV